MPSRNPTPPGPPNPIQRALGALKQAARALVTRLKPAPKRDRHAQAQALLDCLTQLFPGYANQPIGPAPTPATATLTPQSAPHPEHLAELLAFFDYLTQRFAGYGNQPITPEPTPAPETPTPQPTPTPTRKRPRAPRPAPAPAATPDTRARRSTASRRRPRLRQIPKTHQQESSFLKKRAKKLLTILDTC